MAAFLCAKEEVDYCVRLKCWESLNEPLATDQDLETKIARMRNKGMLTENPYHTLAGS